MKAYELWFCGECYEQYDYQREAEKCCTDEEGMND